MSLQIDRDVKVWVEDIPKRFLNLARMSDALAIYICSPWISEYFDPALNLVSTLSEKRATKILLTRPPRDAPTRDLLRRLRDEARVRVYVNSRLHAKLYIIEGIEYKYVVIGSPNLTEEARGNIELALLISGNDILTKRMIYSYLGYLKPMCELWRD